MAKKAGAREEAKQASREALLAAGAAEFAARGIDAPSLDDICSRAGYTRGAFYVHFEDRDDFLVAVMERAIGGFLDALTPSGDGGRDLGGVIEAFAGAVSRGGAPLGGKGEVRLAQLLSACARSKAVQKRLAALIGEAMSRVSRAAADGQRSGVLRRDVDAEALGMVLVATVLGIQAMSEAKIPVDVAKGSQTVLTLLLEGARAGERR